jgi:hypothetical protein
MVPTISTQTINHLLITLIVDYGVDCKFAINNKKNFSVQDILIVSVGNDTQLISIVVQQCACFI